MRECARCRAEKEDAEFVNSPKRGSTRSTCCECTKKIKHERYEKDRRRRILESRARRKIMNLYVDELKRKPCTDCKNTFHPYVMDFDHVRGVKVKCISRMRGNRTEQEILEEVAKCDLVCSNCHRMRTLRRGLKGAKSIRLG